MEDFDYFGRLDQETIKAQQKVDSEAAGGGRYVDWKEGLKRFRFYCRAGSVPFIPCKQHWFKDPATGKKIPVICRQLIRESCPGCDYEAELAASGDKASVELADDIKANFFYLANVEDQDDPGTIKLLRTKVTLYKALMGSDEKTTKTALRTRFGDFTDPINGYLVDCIKHEQAPWYTAEVALGPSGIIRSPAKRELGPKLVDLSQEVVVPSLDFVHGIVEGLRTGTSIFNKDSGRGLPNRAPAPRAMTNQRPGNSVQKNIDIPIDDSMFET